MPTDNEIEKQINNSEMKEIKAMLVRIQRQLEESTEVLKT